MKMNSGETPLGKYEITAQLFSLIDGMSAEKQFILLKQLLGTNLPAHLMRLVLDMTETQRVEMLKAMGEGPIEQDAVTTISLDDSNNLMRGKLRQECRIPVRIKTTENTHDCTIIDISTFGAFIQSHTRHAPGKIIQLKFNLPNLKIPFVIEGQIVRSTPAGVGVRFQNITSDQLEAIELYCDVSTAPGGGR